MEAHKFDYNIPELNRRAYGQPEPPLYNQSLIRKEMGIWAGITDGLVAPEDVANTVKGLTGELISIY